MIKKRTRYVLQLRGVYGWVSICDYSKVEYIDNFLKKRNINSSLLWDMNEIRIRRYNKYVRSR